MSGAIGNPTNNNVPSSIPYNLIDDIITIVINCTSALMRATLELSGDNDNTDSITGCNYHICNNTSDIKMMDRAITRSDGRDNNGHYHLYNDSSCDYTVHGIGIVVLYNWQPNHSKTVHLITKNTYHHDMVINNRVIITTTNQCPPDYCTVPNIVHPIIGQTVSTFVQCMTFPTDQVSSRNNANTSITLDNDTTSLIDINQRDDYVLPSIKVGIGYRITTICNWG